MTKQTRLRTVVFVAGCWIILMPPIWAANLSSRFGFDYFEFLAFYKPELMVAAACLVLLPGAWARKGWAIGGLALAAVLLPVVKHFLGSPSSIWPVSSALMLVVAAAAWTQGRTNEQSPSV